MLRKSYTDVMRCVAFVLFLSLPLCLHRLSLFISTTFEIYVYRTQQQQQHYIHTHTECPSANSRTNLICLKRLLLFVNISMLLKLMRAENIQKNKNKSSSTITNQIEIIQSIFFPLTRKLFRRLSFSYLFFESYS